jgi:superfamily II DNA or RNA helicase
MKLRPYQEKAVEGIAEKLSSNRSTVAVLATGLGKTVIFAKAIELGLRMPGRRAIVLAHREELIHQAAAKVEAVTGIKPDIEMGDYRAVEDGFTRSPVLVSSIQTQNAGRGEHRRMHRFRNDHPWMVVVDECHHAVSTSYIRVIDHYMKNPQSRLLGVTATPDRLDNKALGRVFETVAFEYDVADGIRDGWLVPIKQRFVTCDHLDLSSARTSGGDFQLNDLEEALEKSLQEMVVPMVRIVGDRRTLVFAATVHHAERIAEIINRPGMQTGRAEIVCGKTPEEQRARVFREFGEGKLQYLVNVAVATEGWDDPAMDGRGVQVIAMMRPTKSRALYCQMLGRGTRTLPGTIDGIDDSAERRAAIEMSNKGHVLALDFLGNCGRHTLVHAGDILGGDMDEKVAKRYARKAEKDAVEEEIDVLAEIDKAEADEAKALEAKRRAHIVGRARFTSQEIDPFEALGIVPRSIPAWQRRIPASDKQRSMLERNGLRLPMDLDTGRASQLIEALMSKPSDKQAFFLRRHGIDPSRLDRRAASTVIDMVKSNRMDQVSAVLDSMRQPS